MYVLDRVEEKIAIIYDDYDNKIEIPVENIKGNIRDGVLLRKENDLWFVDDKLTNERKKLMQDKLDAILKRK